MRCDRGAAARYRDRVPRRRLSLPDSYDLAATMRALHLKSAGRAAVEHGVALRATRTPEGPGTLELRRHGAVVEAEAWGPGAGWLLEVAPDVLGLHDDPGRFAPPPGLVRELHRRRPGLRLGRTLRPFEAAVTAILGQRVTGRQAAEGFRRLVATLGEPAPGPGELWLPPAPDVLASLGYHDYHRFEIERARAQRLIEAARRVRRIDEVVGMSRDDAWRRLVAVPGIGPWTAAAVMGVAWGDPDAVQLGDYHLPHMVAWALADEPRADDARMLELLAPYVGQRRRVVLLLKGAGIREPRYGPRVAIPTIRSN
jgi:endonuclease III